MALAQHQHDAQIEQARRKSRVLVVDDAHDSQRAVAAILRATGVEVSVADNGLLGYEKAMDAWKSDQPFDIILMDMDMPVLDGWGATRRLRDAGYQGLIIAFTANDAVDCRQRCAEAGCSGFLPKTSGRDYLLATLSGYLDTVTD